jgi:transcriptional regulator with XRE-family HTH domain
MPPGDPTAFATEDTEDAFGELLKRAREARGLALEAVADATRIARHHLEALERSDLDALPAGPFGKGYVRSYAKVLGIDPEPILQDYRVRERERGRGTAEDERRVLEELSRLVRRDEPKRLLPTPLRSAGFVLAATLVLAVALTLSLAFGVLTMRRSTVARARAPLTSTAPPRTALAPAGGASFEPKKAVLPPHDRALEAPALPTDALEVSAHGVGTGLVDHRLVGGADRFPAGSHVSFWTLVVGGRPGHVIRHVWFHEGRAVMRADLPIGGPHWRTSSRLLLPQGSIGRWAVEARTSDGRLLARGEFACEAAHP